VAIYSLYFLLYPPQQILQSLYTGMKAYKSINDENDIRLFRPHLNMKRLSNSMERLCLPGSDFDHEELIDCIAKLVRLGQFVEVFLC
jgi:branched-subunit amino acid aminotransferase/4-amino-4-deoxychorismate lyase